ncbi:hypothetical protein UY3_07808 [Chelonia mydas]|uniref:Uncharacterized protein n=1 Tax=Chelonia mydas TaxID=8469 RepID=M7C3K6_CHEMY|nr:hypothetical protein UY3_07808 [Chelonia mydas]
MVMQLWDDEQLLQNFRTRKTTFQKLCEELSPALKRSNTKMRAALTVEKQEVIAPWKLATPDCYQAVGNLWSGEIYHEFVVNQVARASNRVQLSFLSKLGDFLSKLGVGSQGAFPPNQRVKSYSLSLSGQGQTKLTPTPGRGGVGQEVQRAGPLAQSGQHQGGREGDTGCWLFPSDPAAEPGEALDQEKSDLVEGLGLPGLPAAEYPEELEEPGSNPGQHDPDAEGKLELELPAAEYSDELEGPEGPARETG